MLPPPVQCRGICSGIREVLQSAVSMSEGVICLSGCHEKPYTRRILCLRGGSRGNHTHLRETRIACRSPQNLWPTRCLTCEALLVMFAASVVVECPQVKAASAEHRAACPSSERVRTPRSKAPQSCRKGTQPLTAAVTACWVVRRGCWWWEEAALNHEGKSAPSIVKPTAETDTDASAYSFMSGCMASLHTSLIFEPINGLKESALEARL